MRNVSGGDDASGPWPIVMLVIAITVSILSAGCVSTPRSRTSCPYPRTCSITEVTSRGQEYCVAHKGLIDVHYGRSTAIVVCGDGTTGVVVCCKDIGKDV
jgi:hypothetical protein